MKQPKKETTQAKSVEPKKEDLVKLANDLFTAQTGKEADEQMQRRLSAAVNVVFGLHALRPYANPQLAFASDAVLIYELADHHLTSPRAKQVAYDVARTYQEKSGFGMQEKKGE